MGRNGEGKIRFLLEPREDTPTHSAALPVKRAGPRIGAASTSFGR